MSLEQLEHLIRACADIAADDDIGWCMEVHDLVLAKCMAGRDKDWQFAVQALTHGLVQAEQLRARVGLLPVAVGEQDAVARGLEARLQRPEPGRSPS